MFRILSLALVFSQAVHGQPAKTATFEVADVHVSPAGTTPKGGFLPGRLDLRSATMLELISIAYNTPNERIVGGPSWLNTDRFDIIAKAPSTEATPEAMQPMIQALLADRFKLVARSEKKDLQVYALVQGKKKLQPAAKPGEPDCPRVDGDAALLHRACHSFKMSDLIELLPQIARLYIDHPIVDMTGLTESYDFQLDWMGKAPYLAAKANSEGPRAVSLFDAIEKIGLKLELRTQPMPVIAVESVNQKPTDNLPGVGKAIAEPPTEFEVAAIKPSKPGATETGGFRASRLDLQAFTMKTLVAVAFDLDDDRVVGPKWMETDRFDIVAKAPNNSTDESMRRMLKALLVQQFKMATHDEDQPVAVFALTQGKRAVKLKGADAATRSECKIEVGDRGRVYSCHNTTMAQLAERLPGVAAAYINRPMVDLTGLKGAYDFDLIWTPRGRLATPTASSDGSVQASAPTADLTVFEAIDKQLGLKLAEQKHPMPVVVVDHMERTPIPN